MAKPIQFRRRRSRRNKSKHVWVLFKQGISIMSFSHWELGMRFIRDAGLFDQRADSK